MPTAKQKYDKNPPFFPYDQNLRLYHRFSLPQASQGLRIALELPRAHPPARPEPAVRGRPEHAAPSNPEHVHAAGGGASPARGRPARARPRQGRGRRAERPLDAQEVREGRGQGGGGDDGRVLVLRRGVPVQDEDTRIVRHAEAVQGVFAEEGELQVSGWFFLYGF